jgi:hypothetical protein
MLTGRVRSMYCTVHIILHLLYFINVNRWSKIHVLYRTYHTPLDGVLYNTWLLLHLLALMNYNKWSMICTVQYMDVNLPVNIDELQVVEYDMYCTIHGTYYTCLHWWITTNGVWCVLYNTWFLLHLLAPCTGQYISYSTWCNSSMLTGGVRSMYCTVHIILHLLYFINVNR